MRTLHGDELNKIHGALNLTQTATLVGGVSGTGTGIYFGTHLGLAGLEFTFTHPQLAYPGYLLSIGVLVVFPLVGTLVGGLAGYAVGSVLDNLLYQAGISNC